MSIQKYKSVSDMPPPPAAPGQDLADRIRTLWNRAFLLSPPHFVRGVTRFTSTEEADAMRAANEVERMRRSAQQRG
ncbi:MAG TPA: hypothetical protein VF331_06795 [Polyangiales bacterium]